MSLLQKAAHRSLDALFAGPWFDGAWAARLRGKAVCFCYHRVEDPALHPFLTESGYPAITPEGLRDDVRFLKDRGFDILTFEDWRKKGALDPQRPHAILSFDDCFRDNYENGRQVLDGEKVRGVFFQATSIVESEDLMWEQAIFWYCHDPRTRPVFAEKARQTLADDAKAQRLEGPALAFYLVECVALDRALEILAEAQKAFSRDETRSLAAELYPTRAHLAAAQASGHEMASHGHFHYKRENVTAAQFESDMKVSIEKILEWTGATALSYAYPHGNFTPGDRAICARYFKHVATVRHGVIDASTDPLELPRFYWVGPAKSPVRRKRWLLTGRS
jgi:peptidoglycan/xylan/chitin deacetylase (PgdA/CDA1 family)